jgi:hypothetical protein
VAEPEGLAQRQREQPAAVGRERNVVAGRPAAVPERVEDGEAHVLDRGLGRDRPGREAPRVGDQPEQHVPRLHLVVVGRPGQVLRADHRDPGAVGEPGPVTQLRDVVGAARHEPLLRGLLGHAHAAADLGPGGAGAAGLVDEVPDEVVGVVGELLGDQHGVGEVGERVAAGMGGQHGGDQVVQAYGMGMVGHASTVS